MREDTTEISPWLSAFRLDLRSLALGRIFVGTVVFCDFLQALQFLILSGPYDSFTPWSHRFVFLFIRIGDAS